MNQALTAASIVLKFAQYLAPNIFGKRTPTQVNLELDEKTKNLLEEKESEKKFQYVNINGTKEEIVTYIKYDILPNKRKDHKHVDLVSNRRKKHKHDAENKQSNPQLSR